MNRIIENLGGIGTFGIISVCLFVVVFTASLFWAFCLKKPFLDAMQTLPLDDGTPDATQKGDDHDE